jgi:hypothetical protein
MVDVVNLLEPFQPPPDVLLHNPAVFEHAPAIRCLDLSVAGLEV